MRRPFALIALLAGPAMAEPAPPEWTAPVVGLSWGILCLQIEMDRIAAPGTVSGWMHQLDRDVDWHWPDTQVVPASIGLAFGIRAVGLPGTATEIEVRLTRPDRPQPETWTGFLSEGDSFFGFFRFDTPEELVPGLWVFEGWDGGSQLYRAEFQVVPAPALPRIAEACGAIS
jgi:Domain of unknown function (DUF3859)